MGTFPALIDFDQLSEAFSNYIVDKNLKILEFPLLYKKSLKELDGAFIHTTIDSSSKIIVGFSNPSIRDFIHNYLLEEPFYLSEICRKAISFSQVVQIWNILENNDKSKRIHEHIDLSIFLSTTKRLFEASNSFVYLRLNKEDLSLENKLYQLLSIAVSLDSTELNEFINKKLDLIIAKNYNNETNIEKLYDILQTIKENEKLLSNDLNELLESSKYRIISNKPTSIHEFYLVANFLKNFDITFDQEEFIYLEDRLNLILDMGVDIDDEGGIFTYNPEGDYFYNIGYGIGDLEEIKFDLDIIFEFFSLDLINFIKKDIIEKIKNFESKYNDYQNDTIDEIKVTSLEKGEFEVDSLFEGLREKEDYSY
jgi:hypothetical protein